MIQQHFAGHALINGLNIYHEIHGNGFPLVLLHGGGSTITSNYGHVLPLFAEKHRVIAIELQAHGHTPDRDQPLSFEQDADDVAALLKHLDIDRANFFGFSNGGTTCLQIAIRHPQLVNKLVPASAIYKRNGMQTGFFEGMQQASIEYMPGPLNDAYFAANPDQEGYEAMFYRDVARMVNFKDIDDILIRSIQAPTLVINGDKDVVLTEHALELSRTIPRAQLAVFPAGHGDYIGEVLAATRQSKLPELVVAIINEFLQ